MAHSHEEKISRFVDSIDRKLQVKDSTYSHLSVILSKCGWQKKGSSNLQRISRALESRDIYCDPELTTRRRTSEQIDFKRDPWVRRLLCAEEDHLRDFLFRNFHLIPEFDSLEDPEKEFELTRSGKWVDILCRERGTRAYVVIELKLDDGDPIKQIHEYLIEVKREKAKDRFDVKGIIITGRPTALAVSYQNIGEFPVRWLTYNIDVTLHDATDARPDKPGES